MAEEKELPTGEELKETSEESSSQQEETQEEEGREEEGGNESQEDDSPDDEEVTIKKSELERLKEERENYKTVALSKKEGKKKKGKQESGDYVTRDELFKENSREAIRRTTNPSDDDDEDTRAMKQEINDNWNSVREFYKAGKSTNVKDIEEGIYDAYALWKRRNPGKSSPEDKVGKAALAEQHGRGGKSPRETAPKKKQVLTEKGTDMDTWYGKKE